MATKYSVTKEIFSKRLKELMDDVNETTYSLGEVINLSAATISRYADGKMAPKITTIYSMAEHFNVNPVWLMGYDVEKNIDLTQQKYKNLSESEKDLIINFNKLNDLGKSKVLDYSKDLSENIKYTYEKPQVCAAHDDNLTDDEKETMNNIINAFEKKLK